MCKETQLWKRIETSHKGFSVGKAVIGAALGGIPGTIIGGGIGKKTKTYCYGNCGFSHEYTK